MNNRWVLAALMLVALVGGVYLGITVSPPSETQYLQRYPQPRALAPVKLIDQDGQAFTETELQDKWTLAFVGYTFCPDICPTTLAELKAIYPELKALGGEHPVQVLFISVDPNRDTVARMKEYVDFFDSEFIGVTAEHAVLFPLVRSMGMLYAIANSTDDPNYLVDHSSSVVVINPQGQVMGRFKPDLTGQLAIASGQQILADLPILVKG